MTTTAVTSTGTGGDDELITVREVSAMFPAKIGDGTVHGWIKRGIKLEDGSRIRLASRRVGGRIYTTRRDVREFNARMEAIAAKRERQAEVNSDQRRKL